MIRRTHIAAALCAVLVGGCQMFQPQPGFVGNAPPRGPSIDGTWRSGDGLATTTFTRGSLATRFIDTNELVGQGTYTVQGNQANMNWVSLRNGQARSAVCTINRNQMNCRPPSGDAFVLNRA